jgi:putative glycerol-1-phosphate prenyltransferase
MIKRVADQISIPLIVGGGIKTPEKAQESCKAGADLIVVGNAIEKEVSLISEISAAIKNSSSL